MSDERKPDTKKVFFQVKGDSKESIHDFIMEDLKRVWKAEIKISREVLAHADFKAENVLADAQKQILDLLARTEAEAEGNVESRADALAKLQLQSDLLEAAGAILKQPRVAIARAPGFTFCRILGSCLPKELRTALQAQHADAYSFYVELLASGDMRAAQRVRMMMYVWMCWAIAAGIVPMMLGFFKSAAGTSKE